jgi:hypothetical protein
MIRWVVGGELDGVGVGKFPSVSGPSNHDIEKLPKPIVIGRTRITQEIELEVGAENPRFRPGFLRKKDEEERRQKRTVEEDVWFIKDRDGRECFKGKPTMASSSSQWFAVREVMTADGEKEYHVHAIRDWLNFTPVTHAQKSARDLEESERLMKELKIKEKKEYSEYLKLKSKKAEEAGVGVPNKEDYEDTGVSDKKRTLRILRKKVLKKIRGDGDDVDIADSAVAFQGADRDIEGEWEGNEAFSDDDEQLFEDEANSKLELDIDVEDDDVVKDKEAVVVNEEADIDEVEVDMLFKDTFGDEISKIMNEEHAKEKGTAEEDLDDELKQYAGSSGDDDEETGAEVVSQSSAATPQPAPVAPVMMVRKTTKEDQMRARIKGMFWRNEYKLKLKDILAQFPGLNRASEDYQFLTKALKDLAEVKDGVLHLKQQFRK